MDAYDIVRECLIDNLDPYNNNLIIGNSLGGAFTFKFCMENPAFAQRAVLISPAGAPFPTTAEDVIRPFMAKTFGDACKIIERIWTNPKMSNYVIAPLLIRTAAQPGFQSMLESIISIDQDPNGPLAQMLFSPQDLQNFPVPALFIWGDQDHVLPMEMRDYFDAHLPTSVPRIFPSDLGHCPHYENPSFVAQMIKQWMNS